MDKYIEFISVLESENDSCELQRMATACYLAGDFQLAAGLQQMANSVDARVAGNLQRAEDLKKMADVNIRLANPSDNSIGIDRVRHLEIMANSSQRVLDAAVAKLRLAIFDLPKINLAPIPDSLAQAIGDLKSADVDNDIIKQVSNIVCAILANGFSDFEAELSVWHSSIVQIKCRIPLDIQWLITPSKFPWPGVCARVIFMNNGKIDSRSFWSAHTLIDHFRTMITEDQESGTDEQ